MSGTREGVRGIAKNKTSKMPAFTEHTLLSWEPNDSLWGGGITHAVVMVRKTKQGKSDRKWNVL